MASGDKIGIIPGYPESTGALTDYNEQNKLNQYQLRYFGDKSTEYFKYGLQQLDNNPYALDEDPVIFGFDISINTISSPLFNEMNPFFDYIGPRIKEIDSRRKVYQDFVDHIALFFDKPDTNMLSNFKSHYIKKINGVDKLIENTDQAFTKFKEDKITITMMEDTFLNGGYLGMLYRTLSYSRLNGKQLIPENLLRFDMDITISEIRNYNKVINSITNPDGSVTDAINVVKDNVSKYVYHLYDCQFFFDNNSHDSTVSNVDKSIREDFEFSITWKHTQSEFQKFKIDEFKYLNNKNKDPNVYSDFNPTDPTPPTKDPYLIYNKNSKDEAQTELDSKSQLSDLKNQTKISQLAGIKKPGDLNGDGKVSFKENFKSQLDTIKENTKKNILIAVQTKRNQLLNKAVEAIRGSLGLRRINAPYNVYDNNASVFGMLKNDLINFGGNQFNSLLGLGNSALNKKK